MILKAELKLGLTNLHKIAKDNDLTLDEVRQMLKKAEEDQAYGVYLKLRGENGEMYLILSEHIK